MRAASRTALLSTAVAATGLEKQPLQGVGDVPLSSPGACVAVAHARSLQRYLCSTRKGMQDVGGSSCGLGELMFPIDCEVGTRYISCQRAREASPRSIGGIASILRCAKLHSCSKCDKLDCPVPQRYFDAKYADDSPPHGTKKNLRRNPNRGHRTHMARTSVPVYVWGPFWRSTVTATPPDGCPPLASACWNAKCSVSALCAQELEVGRAMQEKQKAGWRQGQLCCLSRVVEGVRDSFVCRRWGAGIGQSGQNNKPAPAENHDNRYAAYARVPQSQTS